MSLFADYVAKLAAIPDGEGSLLDNMVILYGASMSDGNRHDPHNLPILLVGGCGGRLKGGRHGTQRINPDTTLGPSSPSLLGLRQNAPRRGPCEL